MKKLQILVSILLCLLLCGCGMDFSEQVFEPTVPMPDTDIIPYAQQRYLIDGLDEQAFVNLCAMYEAAVEFEEECDLPYPMEADEIDALLRILHYECPELLQLDFARTIHYMTRDDLAVQVELPIAMDEEEYEEQYEACVEVAEDILRQTEDMRPEEQEKYVYDYITGNCTYDAEHPNAGSMYGCLVQGYAKCDGISLSVKWLLEQMGFICLCIAGDPADGGEGHAWNVVELDGVFYDMDVTADVSREGEDRDRLYPAYHVDRNLIRDYYIVEPGLSLFAKLPGTASMGNSYHALHGNYIPEGEDPALEERFLNAYKNQDSFSLQFEDSREYARFMEELEENIDEIGEKNNLPGWKWECRSQDDYCILKISVSKP